MPRFASKGRYMEYGILSFIAIAVVWFLSKMDTSAAMLMIVASLGLSMALFCFTNLYIGFYTLIGMGFIIASLDRMLAGRLPLTSILLLLPCILICLVFFNGMREKNSSWMSWHPIVYFYFLLTAYMVVEIFNPQMHSLLGWLSAFWQRLSYIFLLIISCYLFKDLKSIRFFFKFVIGSFFITALYGCVQQWFGLSSFDSRWIHSDPHIYGLFSLPAGGIRKFSFLTDPANFGTLMASSALATLVLIFGPFSKRNKAILSIFVVIILLGMSYSGTRTANVMMVAGLALYILMTLYQRRTQVLAIITGASLLFILYVPIYGNVTLNRFRSAFNEPTDDASYNIRTVHRHMMQSYMYQYPFGGGINTAGAPGEKYNPHHRLAGFPPDSAYFSKALQEGWFGLALQCLFLFMILFYCVHYFYKCRNEEIRTYYASMATMLFASFLGAYAQFTISSVPQSLIFVPFLACIVKLHTFDTPELSKNLQKSQNP